jgi:uncharacterized Fe-S cluster-containing radical SAM superfamily enzyme
MKVFILQEQNGGEPSVFSSFEKMLKSIKFIDGLDNVDEETNTIVIDKKYFYNWVETIIDSNC